VPVGFAVRHAAPPAYPTTNPPQTPYRHARHYTGWTAGDLDGMLAEHAAGRGARVAAQASFHHEGYFPVVVSSLRPSFQRRVGRGGSRHRGDPEFGEEQGFTWLVRLALLLLERPTPACPSEVLCQRGWLSGRVNRCQHGASELFLSAHSSRKCRAEADALAAEIVLSGKAAAIRSRAPRSTAARRGGPTLACCRDTGENPGCGWEAAP